MPSAPLLVPGEKSRDVSTASVTLDAKEAVDIAQGLEENVFLFVPNLIGYTRIILAAVALNYMPYNPSFATVLYGLSCLLDAVDGHAARLLHQTSRFGAVLDMITDRCTTSGLLCYLSSAYPSYALAFQALIALDFSSHYVHMYSTLLTGSKSHKVIETDVSRVLSFYYNNPMSESWDRTPPLTFSKTTLFIFCACNELFFFALYLMKWDNTPLNLPILPPFDLIPGLATWVASLTFAKILALITFPICFGKNVINVVQGWKASKILVGVDLAERTKMRDRERQERVQKEVK
ncbi:related to CDP diacylglycerol-inositol 3-phosphatidyltransferase [Serendipita indica DSM 11827]|uniref:CDP-diacylglycerol--inositol 3-phosphatidyltransferase n=1 Tax=Serendipita indica (strain DSM 11827) TaxID=1109443 RepID=G4T6K1_SERID|nr:related to CDP diacylglycerol-inositol 3-phosphatidyltransferase [Serendipita indica DSM 11827]